MDKMLEMLTTYRPHELFPKVGKICLIETG